MRQKLNIKRLILDHYYNYLFGICVVYSKMIKHLNVSESGG